MSAASVTTASEKKNDDSRSEQLILSLLADCHPHPLSELDSLCLPDSEIDEALNRLLHEEYIYLVDDCYLVVNKP